jgi:hypothetical protein
VPDAATQLEVDPHVVETSLRSGLLSLRQSLIEQLGESEL